MSWILKLQVTIVCIIGCLGEASGLTCPAVYPSVVPKSGTMSPGSSAFLLKPKHDGPVRVVIDGLETPLIPVTTESPGFYDVFRFLLPTEAGPIHVAIEEGDGSAFSQVRTYSLVIQDISRPSLDAALKIRQGDGNDLSVSLPVPAMGHQVIWQEGAERKRVVFPDDLWDFTKCFGDWSHRH